MTKLNMPTLPDSDNDSEEDKAMFAEFFDNARKGDATYADVIIKISLSVTSADHVNIIDWSLDNLELSDDQKSKLSQHRTNISK